MFAKPFLIKRLALLLSVLCTSIVCKAQLIKVDNGVTVNHLRNKDLDIFAGKFSAYAGQVGVEFLGHKHFYLSSGVGYQKLGGVGEKQRGAVYVPDREDWSYIQLNTVFRGRLLVSKTEIFAGAGPYVNVLAGENNMKDAVYTGYEVKRTNWGGRLEAGVNETPGRFKVGVYVSCLLPLSSTIKTPYTDWGARSLGIFASLGYRLK